MSGLEASHGEELHRRSTEKGPTILQLTDIPVQVSLAKVAFPNDPHPMERWLSEGDLSSRFRAYVEDPARTESERHVDVADEHALVALLEAIKAHPPETIH